ncbi:hypothetical protein K9L05_03020 [Candidatus Babeliales bacterium]|nr:hypothetical protein [Candidatus Babeliales bacterium]
MSKKLLKKNFIGYCALFLIFSNSFKLLNSHQGYPEPLFKVSENLLQKKKKSIKMDKSKTSNKILKEIKENGDKSRVFIIDNFIQFLTISAKFPKKSMVIKIYDSRYDSRKDTQNIFQELADKFNENAVFLSLDAEKNPKLLNFLMNIILAENQIIPINGSIDLPIFLFCASQSVSFVGLNLAFKPNSIRILIKPGQIDQNILSKNIEKLLKK